MANIFSVSNSEDLMNALASAKGGDTIELAGGDYGRLSLHDPKSGFNVRFDAPVVITSADPDEPASFSEMMIHGARNITLENIIFDYEFSNDDPRWHRPFEINNSENMTIKDSVFQGDVASGISDTSDGFGYAYGLSVRHGKNISIESNEFKSWTLGSVFDDIEGLTVSQNEYHDLKRDGAGFVNVRSALIEENYFHDFRAHPDSTGHRDFIQFWTNGTDQPSTDIVIRSNILDIGEGSWAQSIFMRNEEVDTGRAGEEMFYRNILIEDNVIHNGHAHGITVGETSGLTIRNNSVLHAKGEMHGLEGLGSVPKINVKSESNSVVINNNITSDIKGYENQSGWNVDGNAIIQPTDYLERFIISSLDSVGGKHNFIALPDGLIEALQAGAVRTQFDDAPDVLIPLFQVYSDTSSSQTLVFDASLTAGPSGVVLESEAEFQWNFGDGNIANGRTVKHEFADPGYHDVTLTVIDNDGTMAQTQFTAGIAGNDLLQFNAREGRFEALAYGEQTVLDESEVPLQKTSDGYNLKLGDEGKQFDVSASAWSQFFGTTQFEMSMTLKASSPGSSGEVARLFESFLTSVDQDGNFKLVLFLDDGSRINMRTEGVSVNDGATHDVSVRFDGKAGVAEILINDQVVASESVFGALGDGGRSLMFGNIWGKQNFDGELSAFTLSADSRDFPMHDGSSANLSELAPAPDSEQTPGESDETQVPDVPKEQDDTTPPSNEDEAGVLEPLLNGGYHLDIASVTTSDSVTLHDDTHPAETTDGFALIFDGKKDFASLGRLTEFETSQKLAFSVDFVRDNSSATEKLVWNHLKVGLTLEGDGLRVHAQNAENHFGKGFKIDDLGLSEGNRHNATVMVDAETDRLQVVVNDVLVLDERGTDFDFVGAGGHEWGWSLGIAWKQWFEGEVHNFQVSDEFEFIETGMENGTMLG